MKVNTKKSEEGNRKIGIKERRDIGFLIVLFNMMGGNTYSNYVFADPSNSNRLKESTWYKRQKVVCEAIETAGKQHFKEYRMELLRLLESREIDHICIALDGAWTHRGRKSIMHSFIVHAYDLKTILMLITKQKQHKMLLLVKSEEGDNLENGEFVKEYIVVKTGNYKGSSKGMEGDAMEEAMKELGEDGLLKYVKYICSDDDGAIVKIVEDQEGTMHIIICHDPGHRQKNLLRTLKEKLGEGRYKTFAYRIGKFFMRCIKRTEEKFPVRSDVKQRKEMFMTLWKHVYTHYVRKQCVAACPCNQFYSDEISENDRFEFEVVERVMSAGDARQKMKRIIFQKGRDGDTEMVVRRPPVEADESAELAVDDLTEESSNAASLPVKMRYRHKYWLDINNKATDKKKWESIQYILRLASERIEDVLHCMNTCLVECSNFRRLKFLRKDRFYYSSFAARSFLSALSEDLSSLSIFKKIADHVGLSENTHDSEDWKTFWENVIEVCKSKEQTKKRCRRRKRSLSYRMRHNQLSKIKIEVNLENKKSRLDRSKKRAYKSYKQKRLQPLERPRGSMKQTDLQELYDQKIEGIRKCATCGWLYKKNHCQSQCDKKKAKQTPTVSSTLGSVNTQTSAIQVGIFDETNPCNNDV